jgi:transmembrane sensor
MPATSPAASGSPSEIPHRAMEEAAEWYALLVSGQAGGNDKARWQSWLAASPHHRQAWGYVESVSRRVLAPLQQTPDPQATSDSLLAVNQRLLKRRRVLTRVAAFTGIGLLGWGAWYRMSVGQFVSALAADHHSGTGEIREVALPDGTRVWLNTASAFNADYQPALRRLHLLAGEILITTAADASRPFVVDTAQGRLRALGTRFTVRLEEGKTFLAVYEGKVEVRIANGSAAVVIPAGQQTTFDGVAVQRVSPADPARQAWSQGQLVAWDLPLQEIVQELRRYHGGHLGVAPELAQRRVFGIYPLGDVPQTMNMLADAVHARVSRPLPWWTTIEADDRSSASKK